MSKRDDVTQLLIDMLAAFTQENELSRMGGPPGSGYDRCVICQNITRTQGQQDKRPHHPKCPVFKFERRVLEIIG